MSTNLDGGEPWGDLRSGNHSEIPFRFRLRRLFLITLLVGATLGFIVNLPSMLFWAYRQWEVGKQYDQRTFENRQFTLSITAFHQRGAVFAAAGGFYRYEVKTASDWWWRTIGMFRYSSPEPIPSDHLRRITDSCAYFFHEQILGV